MYKLVAGLIRLVCKILLRLEVEGRENIPERGPLIVIFNHCSVLDVVFLPVVLPFEIVGFAAYKLRVMPEIRSLLPPDYHGYYKDTEG